VQDPRRRPPTRDTSRPGRLPRMGPARPYRPLPCRSGVSRRSGLGLPLASSRRAAPPHDECALVDVDPSLPRRWREPPDVRLPPYPPRHRDAPCQQRDAARGRQPLCFPYPKTSPRCSPSSRRLPLLSELRHGPILTSLSSMQRLAGHRRPTARDSRGPSTELPPRRPHARCMRPGGQVGAARPRSGCAAALSLAIPRSAEAILLGQRGGLRPHGADRLVVVL